MGSLRSVQLYIVRHGQADSNEMSVLTSYPEARPMHLTESGKQKIQALAEHFRDIKIAGIIASPLTRTIETAEIISSAVGVPVETDIRLRETDFGLYNNHPAEEFFRQYPDPRERTKETRVDGVEAFIDIRTRVEGFLQDVVDAYSGKAIVVVSHGDTIGEILGIIKNQTLRESAWGTMLAKGEYVEVTLTSEMLDPDGVQSVDTE